ncbi:hypothetical protein SUGI_0892350 [Cryptomeria japonica]|nr:hypothetical protein SUGI_0892350 [Cryptomeria japonica]
MAPSACAACRFQRKKCSAECLLAQYFPQDGVQMFAIVHEAYGISRVAKLLRDVKPEERADAVNSLVYEASARVEDPVYGCTRATHQLQQRIADLESQLAATQADLLNDKPVYPLTIGGDDAGNVLYSPSQHSQYSMCEEDPMLLWELLWHV